jgi:hypothetical protein
MTTLKGPGAPKTYDGSLHAGSVHKTFMLTATQVRHCGLASCTRAGTPR